ncbi:response regulator [Paludibacterium paludis]|uniref:Response regulatory domain-containing protein n=1 Tax=Paludibacterium paludis TaxID=1225769 RepID=A0A918P1E1_9NEIS|nr:response regulator [Paludibacterium paludis]GGY12045.1 hypothetical protein GCM10011289_13840 [Paludibacterium paludis]
MDKNKVLVIDDDPLAFEIIKGTLKEKFALSYAATGEDGLARLEGEDPFLILLDIQMPGIDGFSVASRIRDMALADQPYIIFISAHNTTEERLKAYAAGGDDFILKPLSPKEVLFKAELAQETHHDIQHLKASAQEAVTAAEEAQCLGIGMQCLRRLLTGREPGELVDALLAALAALGLKGVAQASTDGGVVTRNTEGRSSQMERVLLEGLATEERHVVDYGSRTTFQYPGLQLLAKNMPEDDEEQRSRYRDVLVQLAQSASERLAAFAPAQAGSGIEDVKLYHAEVLSILGDARRSLSDTAHELRLSLDQEDTLLDVMNETTRRVNRTLQTFIRR